MNRMSPGCKCCCFCDKSDVCLVLDSTGSMDYLLSALTDIFNEFPDDFDASSCRWALVDYKDFSDDPPYQWESDGYKVWTPFVTLEEMLEFLPDLEASGGGDTPEQGFVALKFVGEHWLDELDGRDDPEIKRVVIWGGDAPSHNGEIDRSPLDNWTYPTRAEVITAVTDSELQVFCLDGGDLNGAATADNAAGAADEIAEATDGEVITATNKKEIREALCKALSKTKTPSE